MADRETKSSLGLIMSFFREKSVLSEGAISFSGLVKSKHNQSSEMVIKSGIVPDFALDGALQCKSFAIIAHHSPGRTES
jgi:hypothetical protein